MVPGDRRADSEKIARAAGATFARIAGPEEVAEATGFDPGAVAPFPLPKVDSAPHRPDAARASPSCGSEPAPRATWRRSRRPSWYASRGPGPMDVVESRT